MHELTADLAAETADVRKLVAGLDEAGWRRPTPAIGWAIGDQISHLAYFDDAAVISATDQERFAAELMSDVDAGLTADDVMEQYRNLTGAELLIWFDESRLRLCDVFAGLDPAARVPWFGPPMSAASSVTARIMETWAHGQDIADALSFVREPSGRLRHVAHIGVRTLPFSYLANGLDVPAEPIRVELTSADDELWTWGPADAANRVTGPALDFCLLVVQRRHRADTAIEATGAVADHWLDIAQAFAGPPGAGRQPSQPDQASTDQTSTDQAE
jgi:uncharacterized protein (TIGR03084 family)